MIRLATFLATYRVLTAILACMRDVSCGSGMRQTRKPGEIRSRRCAYELDKRVGYRAVPLMPRGRPRAPPSPFKPPE